MEQSMNNKRISCDIPWYEFKKCSHYLRWHALTPAIFLWLLDMVHNHHRWFIITTAIDRHIMDNKKHTHIYIVNSHHCTPGWHVTDHPAFSRAHRVPKPWGNTTLAIWLREPLGMRVGWGLISLVAIGRRGCLVAEPGAHFAGGRQAFCQSLPHLGHLWFACRRCQKGAAEELWEEEVGATSAGSAFC